MSVEGAAAQPKYASRAAIVLSVALHVVTIAAARFFAHALLAPAPAPRWVDVTVDEPIPHGETVALGAEGAFEHALPEPREHHYSTGPANEARPDQRRVGRGGTRDATEPALRLSDSVDGLTLHTDPSSFADSDQLPRVDTSDTRESREDRRATPNPMELTFLATGTGTRMQRLKPAEFDPAEGTNGKVPVRPGAELGETHPSDDGLRRTIVGSPAEGARAVATLGVDHATAREDYRRSAAVALARPSVKQGRASVPTVAHGMPSDTVDSNDEVRARVESLISASTAGGNAGAGPGGTLGAEEPGDQGDVGPGFRAPAAGDGEFGESASPLGIENYAAAVTRKVYPYWENAFPMWAKVEGRGGVAIIGVTIVADGSIRGVHVVRASGYPEFDRNVQRALADASPYGPLPDRVRDTGLLLHIAFDAMNPAVGRAGPGPGKR